MWASIHRITLFTLGLIAIGVSGLNFLGYSLFHSWWAKLLLALSTLAAGLGLLILATRPNSSASTSTT
jgi:hypothetical protein